MKPIPAFSSELIEQLLQDVPRPLFKPDKQTMEEHLIRTGERRLVEKLQRRLELTEQEGLIHVQCAKTKST